MARYDWERIEAEFRLGHKTTRELSREYGPSHTAIAKHMKAKGIVQDLQGKIRIATAEAVAKAEVSTVVANVATETDMVSALATVAAAVEIRQRGQLGKLRAMAQSLVDEELPEDLSGAEKRALRFAALIKLTEVEAKLIPLERKVHRLDDETGGEKSFEAWQQKRE